MSSKWLVSNTTLFYLVGCGFYPYSSPALAQSPFKAGEIEVASHFQGMQESVLPLGQDGYGQTLTQELHLSSASLVSPELPLKKRTCATAEAATFRNTPGVAETECNSTS